MLSRSVAWFCLSLMLCSACGGGGGGTGANEPGARAASASTSVEADPRHGHFLGEADVVSATLFAEALITVDGAVRIHISSFLWDRTSIQSGAGPADRLRVPEQSQQFVGSVAFAPGRVSGGGMLLGQMCHVRPPGRFCDAPANAQITLAVTASGDLEGELQVSTPTGQEIWPLRIGKWSAWYNSSASMFTGQFDEELAPFAGDDDVLIDVEDGHMTFQSAVSGCSGEGPLTPHLDGRFGVHDVVLFIEGCKTPYRHLNGELQGLATFSQSGYWDYDGWLVVFLAAPDGAPPRPALSMRGRPRS